MPFCYRNVSKIKQSECRDSIEFQLSSQSLLSAVGRARDPESRGRGFEPRVGCILFRSYRLKLLHIVHTY